MLPVPDQTNNNPQQWILILDRNPIQLSIQSKSLVFLLCKVLGLMKLLSNNSYIWTLSSCNSTGAILCRVIEMGDVPRCNSIRESAPLYGGNPDSSSERTSSCSQTARGRSKSYLTSSTRVRLSSQPNICPLHLESCAT